MTSCTLFKAAGISCLILCACITVLAQNSPFALKVDVSLIPLDVQVHDAAGNPVNSLEINDFMVYEDGVPQDLQHFEATQAPYNVLLLFDVSGSTAQQFPFMLEAANRFLANLRPQDQIAMAAFDTKVSKLLDWRTRSGPSRQVAISPAGGGTDFYNALHWTAQEVSRMPGRKGVIVLTDGIDMRMGRPGEEEAFNNVLRELEESHAQVYFVAINTDSNPAHPGMTPSAKPRKRMEQMAVRSGGRVVFPKTIEDMVPFYVDIARQFAASYTMAYGSNRPAADGRYRRIDVRLKDSAGGYRVSQSRAGYFASGELKGLSSAQVGLPKSSVGSAARSIHAPDAMKDAGLQAPSLVTPIAQALMSPPDREAWRFTWDTVFDAARYQIVVNALGVHAPVVDAETRLPRYEMARKPLLPAGTTSQGWTWKVRARSRDGAWGPWSESRPFTVFVEEIAGLR